MSKHQRTLSVGAAIVAGLAAAPALYAQDYLRMPLGSMMSEGMIGEGGMMGMMGGMMSGMMGMSADMDDLGGMMEHCNQMMQAMDDGRAQRPNEQWRSPEPEQPGQPRG
jgi:hypothetical protein